MTSFLTVILVERQGVTIATAAAFFALVHLLSGLLRVLVGWHSDKRGRRVPQLKGFSAMLALTLLVISAAQGFTSAASVVLLILATVMSLGWNGLAFASVAEMAGHQRAGSALGLYSTLMRVLTVPTAILFGWVAATIGWGPALAVLALFPATGGLITLPLIAEEDRRATFLD